MNSLIHTFGGLGFFLFGMSLMTSGLRKVAGKELRQWVARSTRTPITGVLTGMAITLLIQSSSATTVMAVGFVGAGIIEFTAALGLIFGANIGTTITGWMVAVLGFQLDLNSIALPLLFLSSLIYIFFNETSRLHAFGKSLAGFCLLFIGIGYLQEGLITYQNVIDFSHWQASSLGNRVILVLIGILMTLITQSSSATVAAALTALNASILDLPQAAAVIIGADIGTTATAAMATIGGGVNTRRTGFAHVIYNILTGIAAFFALPIYLSFINLIWPSALETSREVVAVGFHSAFNTLGVIIVLPFTKPFAHLIQKIFPEKLSPLERPFDESLLKNSNAVVEALKLGTKNLTIVVLNNISFLFDSLLLNKKYSLFEIEQAIKKARSYALRIKTADETEAKQVFHCLHILDHIERLVQRCKDVEIIEALENQISLNEQVKILLLLNEKLVQVISTPEDLNSVSNSIYEFSQKLDNEKSEFRAMVIQKATLEQRDGDSLDLELDSHRWLRRVTRHIWRISDYAKSIIKL